MRTNYTESINKEQIDLKNRFNLKNLPTTFPRQRLLQSFVLTIRLAIRLQKDCAHADFNVQNLEKFRSVKRNSLPAVREHVTPKSYVEFALSNSVDEPSMSKQTLMKN